MGRLCCVGIAAIVAAGFSLLAACAITRPEANVTSQSGVEGYVFLGPAAGGLAAWAAGRERRSGLGDLLLTTPRPPAVRQLSLLSATATWTLLAYVLAGLYFGVSTALDATWGGPVAAPILIGALTIAAHTAIGYAAGSFAVTAMQSRLTAALVPVFLFLTELAPILIRGADVQVGPNGRRATFPTRTSRRSSSSRGSGARSSGNRGATSPGRPCSGWVASAPPPSASSPPEPSPLPCRLDGRHRRRRRRRLGLDPARPLTRFATLRSPNRLRARLRPAIHPDLPSPRLRIPAGRDRRLRRSHHPAPGRPARLPYTRRPTANQRY